MALHPVGDTDHGRFRNGLVLDQGALDLEGTDPVATALDDVIRAADKPEIAVGVDCGPVSGQVPVPTEDFGIQVVIIKIPVKSPRGWSV